MQNNDNKLTPADAQMAFHYYSSFFKAWEKHNQWFVIDFSKEPYRTNVLGLCPFFPIRLYSETVFSSVI